jgi:hypothetical protein
VAIATVSRACAVSISRSSLKDARVHRRWISAQLVNQHPSRVVHRECSDHEGLFIPVGS